MGVAAGGFRPDGSRGMSTLDHALDLELAALRGQGLYRELRRFDSAQSPRLAVAGASLLNFSSNDYLGLAAEPALKEAACRAIERYGAGAGASRLICGSLSPHHELDEKMAAFKGTEAALSFSSGYAAALGAICALLGKEDIIILDKLVHASIVDAARLCGATIRVFPHNDLDRLESILVWAAAGRPSRTGVEAGSAPAARAPSKHRAPRVLVVTESIFSMDGDQAPLREMVALKEKHGAWLMVDEAHATGLYGSKRSGLAESLGVSAQIEVQMSTLGKALGSAGGCICGSRNLIACLVNRARSFIFSTAPVPAAAAAAAAAIDLVRSPAGEQRCKLLWDRVKELKAALGLAGESFPSAIVPLLVGAETRAVEVSHRLRERGLFIPAIRYPTVARGRARLRLTLSAAHTPTEVSQAASALAELGLARTEFRPQAGGHRAGPGQP